MAAVSVKRSINWCCRILRLCNVYTTQTGEIFMSTWQSKRCTINTYPICDNPLSGEKNGKYETARPWFQFFEVPFYTPTFTIDVAQLRFNLLQKLRCMKITGVFCEQAAIRNDFRAGVLKSYTVRCIDIQLQARQEQIAKPWPVRQG